MRVLVDIPEQDLKALDELARRRKESRAQVIRTAVAEHLEDKQPQDIGDFVGLWKNHPVDGLEFVRKLRSEW